MTQYGWLNLKQSKHKCPKPYLWFAEPGQRWRCPRKLDSGERCGRTYVVGQLMNGKLAWYEEPTEKPDGKLERFRRVADDELTYWLEQELRSMDHPAVPWDVVAAIRKHFEIGSTR